MQENKFGFLFDLDGVLIDSEKEYSKIWNRVNEEYPSDVKSLAEVIKGCTLEKILDDHYPDPGIREKVVARLYELEQQMHYNYLPGAVALLDNLEKRGIPRVMVTSSNDVKMAHLFDELPDIASRFTFIVTADMITKSKPDPEGYLLGAREAGCEAENCVVLEDSLQGVKAGKNSGAFVIGVAGTLPGDILRPYSDLVVDSLEEIDLDILLEKLKNRNV